MRVPSNFLSIDIHLRSAPLLAGQPNPLYATQQATESPTLSIIEALLPLTGGSSLAPGIAQYDFNVPGEHFNVLSAFPAAFWALCAKLVKKHSGVQWQMPS